MPRFIALFSPDPAFSLQTARALSPRIEKSPGGEFLVEVTERSEQATLQKVLRRSEASHPLKIGLASSRVTAIMAARTQTNVKVVPPGQEQEFLAALPLHLLSVLIPECDQPLLTTLYKWGIRVLGELSSLPKMELIARLGQAGLRLQKIATGEDVEAFPLILEEPRFEANQRLEWTLDALEPLTFILSKILEQLLLQLHRHGQAAQALHLTLQLENGSFYQRSLQLPLPIRNSKLLLSLLRLELQAHPPQMGIVNVSLRATPASPRLTQHSLLEAAQPNIEEMSKTLARLSVLVGKENIGTPVLLNKHRPDAHTLKPICVELERDSLHSTFESNPHSFPLSLRRVRPPQRREFQANQIVACGGPWRSSGDWWTDQVWSREEWDVELVDGSICRIYWDPLRKTWFLEGIYD